MSTSNSLDLIELGTVVDSGRQTRIKVGIPKRELARHVLLTGMPGSGKTSALQSLIYGAHNLGVKFCLVEPSKAELRSLMDVLRDEVWVFTVGAPFSPLFMNMFEVPKGVRIQKHADLLRAVFASSFYMWDPMPQVLEQCILNVYQERGFDLTSDVGGSESKPFPTIEDLIAQVENTKLLYSPEASADIKGALITRLNSLRVGSKALAFNSPRSVPSIEDILEKCIVIELKELSNEEKSLFATMLFTKIYEYVDALGENNDLKYLIVLEEAHRIFPSTDFERGERSGHARGMAVETLGDILKEIRAFGVGVVIVDQSPTQISSIAIENTNLKMVFRTEASKDRGAAGSALGLSNAQTIYLGNLETRHCVCHFEGLHGSTLIKIPEVSRTSISNRVLAERMRSFYQRHRLVSSNETITPVLQLSQGGKGNQRALVEFYGCDCVGNCKNAKTVSPILRNPTVWGLLERAKKADKSSGFVVAARNALVGALMTQKIRGAAAEEISLCCFRQYINRIHYDRNDRRQQIEDLVSQFRQKSKTMESV